LFDIYKETGKTTFTIPMKRYELAAYLNVSRPSLSREMSSMRRENLIDFNGSSIRIKNINSLEELT
jgi:CRP-like cAMP-binding protein